VHEQRLEVRVGVVFAGLVVAVVGLGWREVLEPAPDVVEEALFVVVDEDARGDVPASGES
jgi:hypothetical protein